MIFGKNSDREPNEAQVLEYHPARTYPDQISEKVQCTHISIPQVKQTHAVLLCRPFWMWGAEMGANEKGVVIGNEAVFTRMPHKTSGALTGMDLLRLALERSETAQQAMETIIQLLTDHGQGGICGYENKKMFYHNSFIIADPKEAWVLETAGHLWAGYRVKDIYAISNGLTIGEEFDLSHPDLIETARKKGWLKKGKPFHFAEIFSDWFYTTFSACRKRQSQTISLVKGFIGQMTLEDAFSVLRNHNNNPYRPDDHLLMDNICMHGGNSLTRNASTTGSMVAHMKPDIQTFWATGTSAPCTGIFKPIWFEKDVLPDMVPSPGPVFRPDTLWWHHEKLHRSVLKDYPARMGMYKAERDLLEASIIRKAKNSKDNHHFYVTKDAFTNTRQATQNWIDLILEQPITSRTRYSFRKYWKKQHKKAL